MRITLHVLAVSAGLACTAHDQPMFRLTKIPLLQGEVDGRGESLNSSGHATGYCSGAVNNARGFLWNGVTLIEIPSISGLPDAVFPHGINGSSHVVGVCNFEAFRYDGTTQSIHLFPNFSSIAHAINDAGQIAGQSPVPGAATSHAVRWNAAATQLTDLGVLQENQSSEAFAINSAGLVVGTGTVLISPYTWNHPFFWNGTTMIGLVMPYGPENQGTAYDINDSNQIVGDAEDRLNSRQHALVWHNGTHLDIGTVGNVQGSARAVAINNAGQIIGFSDGPHATFAPFLRHGGVMYQLHDLLHPCSSGWILTDVNDINDAGQIVGTGQDPENISHATAFILTPTNAITCYANCDSSTLAPTLNINDFVCFLGWYAAESPCANCDRSTVDPVLNVGDFICYLNQFAAGCS